MNQQEYHGYLNGVYVGLFIATAKQLAEQGIVAGDAPAPDPVATLAAERAVMSCTPMQGQLALGEKNWGVILAWRDSTSTWSQKVIIDSAQTWVRNSQNIAFFQYLLGFTDTQVDDLFRVAMAIDA
jgi:hypothetical protein